MENVVVRSFIVKHQKDVNIVYNSPGIEDCSDEILRMGQPGRLLVNHWHEAMYGKPSEVSVPAFVSKADLSRTERDLPIADVLENVKDLNGIEIIPMPGHTAGTTAFLCNGGQHRYFFCGDTVWLHNGRWEAVVLGESDRKLYLQSLEVLAETDFDVLVPWVSMVGQPFIDFADRQKIQAQVGGIITRLRRGENQ